MGDQPGGVRRKRTEGFLERVRLPILFGLSSLLFLGAYYFFFAQRKYSYLTGRNFRFLATIGKQLEASLASQARQFRSLAQAEKLTEALKNEEAKSRLVNEIAPKFENVTSSGPKQEAQAVSRQMRMELRHAPEEPLIDAFYPAQVEKGKYLALQGSIKLKSIVEPLFDTRGAFDTLLLANTKGEVIYQQGIRDLSVRQLGSLLDKSRVFPPRRGEMARSVTDLLSSSSDSYPVELNGREYRLFVKPVELPLRKPGSRTSEAHREQTWLICGLVPQKELVYKSLAVSSALLFFLLGALLLALLSWPFLKLKLIGEAQRVGLFDVLLLGLCCVLGISVATLFVLDLQVFTDLEESSKQQAENLAERIEENLRAEIRAAYPVLTNLEATVFRVLAASPTEIAKETEGDRTIRQVVNNPTDLLRKLPAAFASYPLAQSFSLMGEDGRQFYKGATTETVPPSLQLQERSYFKRARANDVWDLNALEDGYERRGAGMAGSSNRFILEPVVAWSSGIRMAVLAKPVTRKTPEGKPVEVKGNKPVVATLSIPMISLIDPVLPPGFKFAVVDNEDENGKVLFHSDLERNSTEDFLAETDYDRRLRSAIFARRAETMRIRYWGEDYFASVRPVQGLPWTVIALKDLKTLRAVNVDWLSTTLLFLLLYSGTLAALLVIVAVARPGYRAEWIWPDPRRLEDYAELGVSYLLTLGGFLLAAWVLRGSAELFVISVLVPALALVMAYVKLQKKGHGREKIALVMGCLLLLGLATALFQAPREIGSGLVPVWLSLLLIVAGFLVVLKVIPFRMEWVVPSGCAEDIGRDRRSINAVYCSCGILLLLLTAVLPTVGFFETAHQIHSKSFVRHGQLKLALEMKKRSARAQKAVAKAAIEVQECLRWEWLTLGDDPLPATAEKCTPSGMKRGLDLYASSFFATETDLTLPEPARKHCACDRRAEADLLSEFLEGVLPRGSAHAAEMRALLHPKASDCSWHWEEEKGDSLTLHSREYPDGPIHLTSTLSPSSQDGTSESKHAGMLLAVGLSPRQIPFLALLSVLLCLSIFLVRFTSRRIFLIDLLEPLGGELDETGPASTGRNLFFVSRGKQWKREVDKDGFFWFHMRDLEDSEKGWPAIRPDLVKEHRRVILVEGFEERIWDRDFNKKKLDFLESLVAMRDRTVIVISSVSPSPLLSEDGRDGHSQPLSSATARRWRQLLSSFTIFEEDLRMKPEDVKRHMTSTLEVVLESNQSQDEATAGTDARKINSKILREEAVNNPHLTAIAWDLDDKVRHLSREQILEEFGERAERYYQALWESCSPEEELVLEHLAEEGLVNEKSRRLIRRLMARGLVRRTPHFRLMNETFRRFVISSARRNEVLGLEKQAEPSAWDKLRGPFFFGLAASITFFFVTQEALLDGVLASLTGLTAGLPAVVKAFDWFGGDRPRLPRFGGGK